MQVVRTSAGLAVFHVEELPRCKECRSFSYLSPDFASIELGGRAETIARLFARTPRSDEQGHQELPGCDKSFPTHERRS
jgi:hypothetical protein